MKKTFLVGTMLVGLAAFLWAGGQTEQVSAEGGIGKVRLVYAELNPDGHPMADVGYFFAEKVKEFSNGAMTIEVYTSGVLGSEKESIQALQMGGGSVDIFRGNTNSLADYNMVKLNLFGMPFIFRDRDHLWKVLESEIGKEFINEPVETKSKMKGLFYTEEGARHFFTTKKVSGMSDLAGMKLRVPRTPIMTDTLKALGIESVPIDWGELYSSLQTGVVDGAEQPFAGYYNNKFYEVSPYYILSSHTYSPGIALMSEQVWNKLSPAQQDVLMKASAAAQEFCKDNAARVDAATLDKIKQVATVIEVKNMAEVQASTSDVVAKYIAGLEDFMTAIKAK